MKLNWNEPVVKAKVQEEMPSWTQGCSKRMRSSFLEASIAGRLRE